MTDKQRIEAATGDRQGWNRMPQVVGEIFQSSGKSKKILAQIKDDEEMLGWADEANRRLFLCCQGDGRDKINLHLAEIETKHPVKLPPYLLSHKVVISQEPSRAILTAESMSITKRNLVCVHLEHGMLHHPVHCVCWTMSHDRRVLSLSNCGFTNLTHHPSHPIRKQHHLQKEMLATALTRTPS